MSQDFLKKLAGVGGFDFGYLLGSAGGDDLSPTLAAFGADGEVAREVGGVN